VDDREAGEVEADGLISLATNSVLHQNVHMTIDPTKTSELRVKHLDMVQTVIGRMANQSATLKNYCLTVTTAVCGFAISLERPWVASLALLPIVTFCLLDAQYLRLERQFRSLFDLIRSEDWSTFPTFEMNRSRAPEVPFIEALRSWSISSFYALLAIGVLILILVSGISYDKFV
jgi:hypothetical protein